MCGGRPRTRSAWVSFSEPAGRRGHQWHARRRGGRVRRGRTARCVRRLKVRRLSMTMWGAPPKMSFCYEAVFQAPGRFECRWMLSTNQFQNFCGSSICVYQCPSVSAVFPFLFACREFFIRVRADGKVRRDRTARCVRRLKVRRLSMTVWGAPGRFECRWMVSTEHPQERQQGAGGSAGELGGAQNRRAEGRESPRDAGKVGGTPNRTRRACKGVVSKLAPMPRFLTAC